MLLQCRATKWMFCNNERHVCVMVIGECVCVCVRERERRERERVRERERESEIDEYTSLGSSSSFMTASFFTRATL